ncbi:MAG: LysM peptidoglycan-binding domain-containing protein [Panacagrimonas sp.]
MKFLRVARGAMFTAFCLGLSVAEAQDVQVPLLGSGAGSELPTPGPASVEPDPLPAVITGSGDTTTGDDGRLFPRYPVLKPNVAFWTRIFSQYSENQSLIHSAEYPWLVFETLDFRGDAAQFSPDELRKLRSVEESRARARYQVLLAQVHAARHVPESLTEEQRRIFQLFSRIEDDGRFLKAAEGVRAQRGLRERTQLALETSGQYLPAMERVFKSYDLPVRLTRLPLVESSFNVDAYSKVGAAGLWQFIPTSARIYMRLNDVVDDRRDPWTSTDAAARHLRDDYAALGSWPLALTAYNHGRGGVARGLALTGGTDLPDLIRNYRAKSFGFASRNFYAEFLAASDVERNWREHFGDIARDTPMEFDVVETRHYVTYETLRRMCNADDALFRKLNPAYRPDVIEGKLYVPPGHLIRVPAGAAKKFAVAYASLGEHERFSSQRVFYLLYKVRRGDTVSRIAKKYGVDQKSIRAASGLGSQSKLRTGQILKIPPRTERRPGPVNVAVGESKPGLTRAEQAAADAAAAKPASKKSKKAFRTHKVKAGQTLSSIAQQYKVSIADLRRANGMGKSSQLRAGQRIKVPSGS